MALVVKVIVVVGFWLEERLTRARVVVPEEGRASVSVTHGVVVVVVVFEIIVVAVAQCIKFGQALVEPGAQSRATGSATYVIGDVGFACGRARQSRRRMVGVSW